MSHYGSKYEGYSPQNFGKNSRVICQQPSEISTFEGYLVTYLLPCKHGVKNEGYVWGLHTPLYFMQEFQGVVVLTYYQEW